MPPLSRPSLLPQPAVLSADPDHDVIPRVLVLTEQGENESGEREMAGVCFHIYARV